MNLEVPVIKIVIADDHDLLRYGLTTMLSKQAHMKIVAEATTGEELINLTRKNLPDIILTDIKMPVMDGIAAARIISGEYPEIGIIALSMYDDSSYIVDMLEAGAMGYLLKNAHKEEVIRAIENVYNHTPYYNGQIADKLKLLISSGKFGHKKRPEIKFTEREREVIHFICKEYTSKQIGEALFISVRTVEWHRKAIQTKIEANNTVGIVVYALLHKLFVP